MARDFVTGLSSEDQAAARPDPSGVDPSRGDLVRTLQSIMDLNDLSDIYEAAQGALDRLPEAKSMRLSQLESDSAAVRYEAVNWLEGHLDAEVIKAMQALRSREMNRTVKGLLGDILADHAQGTAARSDETEGLSPQGNGPVGHQSDAPKGS